MFCSLTSLVIPTPKHDEELNETARVHHAVRRAAITSPLTASEQQHAMPLPRPAQDAVLKLARGG
jgi:hypothetical protein